MSFGELCFFFYVGIDEIIKIEKSNNTNVNKGQETESIGK